MYYIAQFLIINLCTLYFLEYNTNSPTVNKIKAIEKFFKKNDRIYDTGEIEDKKSFLIDLKTLVVDNEFLSDWPNFESDLNENPDYTLNCISLSMHQVCTCLAKSFFKFFFCFSYI